MSKSIFSADSDLFSDKQQEKIINNNVKNSEDDLSDYQKTIEHLFGFYECVNYISNQLYHAANIKIEKNIIYLDSIASKDFFMGDGNQIVNVVYKNIKGKRERIEEKCNPFLTCKYDFLHFVNWEFAYIYKNRLYLIANNKNVNSPFYSHLKYFGLSIYCDDASKFDIFKNTNYLDLRTIKFAVERIYTDDAIEYDTEEFTEEISMFVEDQYIEKTIRCMVLNDKNAHLINSFSDKEFKEEHEKYTSLIKNGNIDRKFGKYDLQYGSIKQFYQPEYLLNRNRRSYINEEIAGGLRDETEREKLENVNESLT